MKNVILSFAMLLGVLSAAPAMAAIGCLPGQCGGAPTPPKDDGLTPPRPAPSRPAFPEYPDSAQVSGYFEVRSPECTEADLVKAKQGAEAEAFDAAVDMLGTDDIKQNAPSYFITVKCEKSIYSSFHGNSWIVHLVAYYTR